MHFVFALYYCYVFDISESIHLKIGRESHETQCNGSNLILLFTCPTNYLYIRCGESRTLSTFLEVGTTYLVLINLSFKNNVIVRAFSYLEKYLFDCELMRFQVSDVLDLFLEIRLQL